MGELTDRNIKKIYGAGAEAYDEVMARGWRSLIDRQEVIASLEPQTGQRFLEIGVGTGLNIPFYPADSEWIGVDLTFEMLIVAEKKIGQDQSVKLLEMSGSTLEFDDEKFDGVLATLVVSACERPKELLSEALRVTKLGGRLSLLDVTSSNIEEVFNIQTTLVAPYSESSGFPAPSERFPGGVIVYTPLRDMRLLAEEAGWTLRNERRFDETNPFTCRTHIVAEKVG